jgi:hypothetical protein
MKIQAEDENVNVVEVLEPIKALGHLFECRVLNWLTW